jgi:uroporphyrinogen-III synthase
LAYLCGRLRRDTLERALRSAGRHCIVIETYDTRDLDYTKENLCAVPGAEPIDAVLIYSAHAAERLAVLWPFAPSAEPTELSTFICISRRTAEPVTGTPGVKTMIAAEPHEDAMFALLCVAAKRAAC